MLNLPYTVDPRLICNHVAPAHSPSKSPSRILIRTPVMFLSSSDGRALTNEKAGAWTGIPGHVVLVFTKYIHVKLIPRSLTPTVSPPHQHLSMISSTSRVGLLVVEALVEKGRYLYTSI